MKSKTKTKNKHPSADFLEVPEKSAKLLLKTHGFDCLLISCMSDIHICICMYVCVSVCMYVCVSFLIAYVCGICTCVCYMYALAGGGQTLIFVVFFDQPLPYFSKHSLS